MTAYSPDVRARARALWLRGGATDEEIAAAVGVTRADTVRDWRRDEGWEDLRKAVDAAAEVRVDAERQALAARIDQRHDQIGEAIEAMIVRAIKTGGNPRAGELRALASAALTAQRLRRIANGLDDKKEGAAPSQEGTRRVVFTLARRPKAAATDASVPAPQAGR